MQQLNTLNIQAYVNDLTLYIQTSDISILKAYNYYEIKSNI